MNKDKLCAKCEMLNFDDYSKQYYCVRYENSHVLRMEYLKDGKNVCPSFVRRKEKK